MAENGQPETLLTAEQVANHFGVCRTTIRRWTNRGLLRPARLNRRIIRYFPSDVARLVRDAADTGGCPMTE